MHKNRILLNIVILLAIPIVNAQITQGSNANAASLAVALCLSAIGAFALFKFEAVKILSTKYNFVEFLTEFFEAIPEYLLHLKEKKLQRKIDSMKQQKTQLLEQLELEKKSTRKIEQQNNLVTEQSRKDAARKEKERKDKEEEEAREKKKKLKEDFEAEKLRQKPAETEKEAKKHVLNDFKANIWNVLHGLELIKTPEEKAEIVKAREQKKAEQERKEQEAQRVLEKEQAEENKKIRKEESARIEREKEIQAENEKKSKALEKEEKKKQERNERIRLEEEARKNKEKDEKKSELHKTPIKTKDTKEQKSCLSMFNMFSKSSIKDDSSLHQWPGSDSNEDILKRSRIAVELGKQLSGKNGKFKISDVLESINVNYKIDKRIIKQMEFEIKTHIVQSHEFETFTEYGNVYFRSKKKS